MTAAPRLKKKRTPVQGLDEMHERMRLPKDVPYYLTGASLTVVAWIILKVKLVKAKLKKAFKREEAVA